jgi:hypothetical protein
MKRLPIAAAALVLAAVSPAPAQEFMNAAAAENFVAGKMFSYSCFDGTEGQGRIQADGSATGTIRTGGRGEARNIRLPAGTLYVRGERICASLRGLPFDPCFNLVRTSDTSFRGAISGLSFMYCEFERGQTQVVRRRAPAMGIRGTFAAGTAPTRP